MGVNIIISVLKTGKQDPDKLDYLHKVISAMVETKQNHKLLIP